MISFLSCLLALVLGYFIYGHFVEKVFGIKEHRLTPAITKADGIDFIALPTWKIFMIQSLNIAGLGPIFGAIMGAKFGTASYLWITLGSIFAGAVHDYLSGMLSLRRGGDSLPELIGRYLGKNAKLIMRIFSIVLMILVGVVFIAGPAGILANMTAEHLDIKFWMFAIFAYYLIATLLPINKLIGNIYPLFAFALLFMALGILVMLLIKQPVLPEFWDGIENTHPNSLPLMPFMFITIACGAISGFHATQSPLMARCLRKERYGKPVFYGAMIVEGAVALIWAAAANYFYNENGMGETNALVIADAITRQWLGPVGAVIALLGIVAAPITSGDTALRSARLMIADFLKLKQRSIKNRLIICIPLFAATIMVLIYSINDKDGFDIIWRYFAWFNQTLAVFTLWALTVYLTVKKKMYGITLLPALLMTFVCGSYICIAPEGLGLNANISYTVGAIHTIIIFVWFFVWKTKYKKRHPVS